MMIVRKKAACFKEGKQLFGDNGLNSVRAERIESKNLKGQIKKNALLTIEILQYNAAIIFSVDETRVGQSPICLTFRK